MLQSFKVGSKSNPNKVAGAIASVIAPGRKLRLECIGAGSLNVAIKAVAIARGFVITSGIDLYVQPAFQTIAFDGEEKTGIILTVEAWV